MKRILMVFLLAFSSISFASQTQTDMIFVLSQGSIDQLVGEDLKSIRKLENRSYELNFGSCSAIVSVTTICAGFEACTEELHFDSSQVFCMPSGVTVSN